MLLNGQAIASITLLHLQELVDNRVPEGRSLDYKLSLPSNADSEKKEFLADVSAMANTEGGVLIYGMATERDETRRDTGVPTACAGVRLANPDAEILRLSSILRDGLDPALTVGVTMRAVPSGDPDSYLLTIGVDRSWQGPHRVTYQRSDKFWRRGEAGKYSPDTMELRRVFMEADSWTADADAYHRERLQALRATSYADHFSLVHILPFGRLSVRLDPRQLTADRLQGVMPMMATGANWRHNAAGFKLFTVGPSSRVEHYVQWLRFGGIEAAASSFRVPQANPADARRINAASVRSNVTNLVTSAIAAIPTKLDIGPPFYLALTLSGVGGCLPYLEGLGASWDACPIDTDPLVLPALVLHDSAQLTSTLQLWWDMLWQAFGFQQAP